MSKDLTTEEKAELFDWMAENWHTDINPDGQEKYMDWSAGSRIYELMLELDGGRDFASSVIEVKNMERDLQLSYLQSWADHYENPPFDPLKCQYVGQMDV